MSIIQQRVAAILNEFEKMSGDKEYFGERLRLADKALTDNYKEIKYSHCSASEGYLAYRRLRTVLRKRRFIKDELMDLLALEQMMNGGFAREKTKLTRAIGRFQAHNARRAAWKKNWRETPEILND